MRIVFDRTFQEAEVYSMCLCRLKELASYLLAIPSGTVTLSGIAQTVVRIFGLEYCSIHVYTEGKWHHFSGSAAGERFTQLKETLQCGHDHPTRMAEIIDEHALGVHYSEIRTGPESIAVLAVKGSLPAKAIDLTACIVGLLLKAMLIDEFLNGQRTTSFTDSLK